MTDDAMTEDMLEGALRSHLPDAPDPAFAQRLKLESRALHARLTRNLGWFDVEAPFGMVRVVHDGKLVHLTTNQVATFEETAARALGAVPEERSDSSVRSAVAAVLHGERKGGPLVFLGELSPFPRAVLEATARIPRGEVRPYSWVAREAHAAGAVRATGTALGHNPVPFLVPCHRVVKSDWELGQYSAGGTQVKERILRTEGVDVERLGRLRREGIRLQGSRTTHIFCMPTCYSGKHLQERNLVDFHSEAEARRNGYRPCLLCKPA